MSNKQTVLVCYHAKCVDGLFAARNVYNSLNRDEYAVTYSPINYGSDETLDCDPQLVDQVDVILFVDWCPTMPVLRTLLEKESRTIIILDHHERAKLNLVEFPVHQYDNLSVVIADNLSGAGLVAALGDSINLWPFWVNRNDQGSLETTVTETDGIQLLTNVSIDAHLDITELDKLTKVVQGRDLWLDGTVEKEMGLYLDAFLKHYNLIQTPPESLDSILDTYGTDEDIIDQGRVIFDTVNSLCLHMLNHALRSTVQIGETTLTVIVGVCIQGYASTFGELGYKQYNHPTIVVGIQPFTSQGKVELSFRCNDGANVDVIAHDLYGGGGHVKASGARIDTTIYNPTEILACVMRYIENNPSTVLVSH